MSRSSNWEQLFRISAERGRRYGCSPALQSSLLAVLATGVEQKLPLVPILDAFADDAPRAWRRDLRALASRLHAGSSLPDALQEMPGLVPADAVMAARVGVESGVLATALRAAAASSGARQQSRAFLLSETLAYLYGLLVAMIAVLGFVSYYIVPKLRMIFADFGTELPVLTQTMIQLIDASVDYFYLFVAFLMLIVLVSMYFYGGSGGLRMLWSVEPLTVLKRMTPRMMASDVLRPLGWVIGSGRPVSGAVATLARHHYDRRVRRRLSRVETDVENGVSCWDSLHRVDLISRSEAELLGSAQRADNLPWALEITAERIERIIEYRLSALFEVVRPVIIICFGVVVGIVVVSLFLPLVKLLSDLS